MKPKTKKIAKIAGGIALAVGAVAAFEAAHDYSYRKKLRVESHREWDGFTRAANTYNRNLMRPYENGGFEEAFMRRVSKYYST